MSNYKCIMHSLRKKVKDTTTLYQVWEGKLAKSCQRQSLQAPTRARAKCLSTFTLQCEELLYRTLGAWQEEQMSNELKPYHTPPFWMPPFHRDTIKIDIVRLVEIGMLKPISNSRNGLFIIQNPKQARKGPGLPGTIWFLTNLCELIKWVVR